MALDKTGSQAFFPYFFMYGKCPKISNIKISDKIAYANSADPDQSAPMEQSDLGLQCLLFH